MTLTLEDGGSGKERLHISDTEVVGAGCHRRATGSTERVRDELDVSSLVRCYGLDACVDLYVEASGREVSLGEVGETFTVEGILEMLESESIVEDIS